MTCLNHTPFCRQALKQAVQRIQFQAARQLSVRLQWLKYRALLCVYSGRINCVRYRSQCASKNNNVVYKASASRLSRPFPETHFAIRQADVCAWYVCPHDCRPWAGTDCRQRGSSEIGHARRRFFLPEGGSPPVYRGYKGEAGSADAELVGYLFETPDYPPEEVGYSAPIDVLVGIDLQGTLTGIEVLHYIESYKSIRGDFINSEYFPQQFSRKNITEDFRSAGTLTASPAQRLPVGQ